MNEKDKSHGTTNEMNFITGLGNFSTPKQLSASNKCKLLTGYLAGCERRTDWNGLNKSALMSYAQNELQVYSKL